MRCQGEQSIKNGTNNSRLQQENARNPVAVRYYVVLSIFFVFATRMFAVETEFQTASGQISISSLTVERWKTLDLHDRRWIAPRLVDLGSANPAKRGLILEILTSDADPFVRTHAAVAGAFFSHSDDRAIRDEILSLSSRPENLQTRDVFLYYGAIMGAQPAAQIAAIGCRISEFEDACRLLRLRMATEQLTLQPAITLPQLKDLQNSCAPFLLKNAMRPPFYERLGSGLPERLNRLRLPLEAAIFQERMLRGVDSAFADESRAKIPFYLSIAGDFASALRYTETRTGLRNLDFRMARIDWMILSGRYKDAVDVLTELIEGNVDLSTLVGKDPWTGFQYSREGLRLRLAMVLHLAGDSSRAARALDMLKESHGRTDLGEPIAEYSKIRLAQILLKDRPELAHKIAEDVTYDAQAQNWVQLEYLATILDVWALYYSKQYFPAVVNFTKAGGIMANAPAEYSRLLGLMVSQNALAPASPQGMIVARLKQILTARPYHRAIYTIRDWTPEDAGQDFFLEQTVANFEARRERMAALYLLEEFRRLEEFYFPAGNNPGGARGLITSDVWYRTLADFPSVRASSRGVLDSGYDNLRGAINAQLALPPLRLTDDSGYLFTFSLR